MWLPNKETIHVALVVPNMSWPLLFGENHLAATQALSDHSNKTVTFRHPAMNFTVACDKATASHDPQAAVTCLFTGKPSVHSAPTRTTVYRGFNLVTVYLTLSAASMGFLGNDLWLSGHELEPGVKVLDGPFSASEAQSIMDFSSNSDTTYHDLPDFQTSRAMNILVHCTKKKASIGHSTFGYLSPCSAQRKTDLDDALMHTADNLCSSLDTFDSLFCHSDDTPPSLVETSPPKSMGVPLHYPHCIIPSKPVKKCLKLVLHKVLGYFILSVSQTGLMIETYLLSVLSRLIHFRRNIMKNCAPNCA